MTRLVFDTNVIVSALLFNGSVPGQAFFWALSHGKILVSEALIRELNNVVRRGKFHQYFSHEERDQFLGSLIRESDLVEISEQIRICRDHKDNQVLELAASGNASLIVTGDADLLVLSPFRDTQIVTPAEFLKSLT